MIEVNFYDLESALIREVKFPGGSPIYHKFGVSDWRPYKEMIRFLHEATQIDLARAEIHLREVWTEKNVNTIQIRRKLYQLNLEDSQSVAT
jgi:hypothetical protein